MSITILQSHSLEQLFKAFVAKQPISSDLLQVLSVQHVITPNVAVQSWLNQQMAEKMGVCSNIHWHDNINEFQWFIFQKLSQNKESVRQANLPRLVMKWKIYQYLLGFITADTLLLAVHEPLFAVIQRIYHYAELHETAEQRLYQRRRMTYWVAAQVASVFGHYLIYREEWLQSWSNNRAISVEDLMQNQYDRREIVDIELEKAMQLEGWQRHLWFTLFRQDFDYIRQIKQQFWLQLEQNQLIREKLPTSLTVFTLLDLAPQQLNFLRKLGQYLDVYIYHFNPTQEYWADSVDPRWKQMQDLKIKQRLLKNNPSLDHETLNRYFLELQNGFNPEIREARHPLLTRFGKQARDHFSLLSQLSGGEEGEWYDLFEDDQGEVTFPNHLLGKLQHDMFYLLEPASHQYELADDDDSIQFHVCHSTQRQVEVLKEQLIHWLAQGTADEPRHLHDILVLTPSLMEIEPHVRGVFGSGDVILPVSLAGSVSLDIQQAWQFVLMRMSWTQERFLPEVFLDWLNLPASRTYYDLDDWKIARISFLLEEAGFKRGFDAEHLKKTLSEHDRDYRFSFKYAIDRLSMAIAIPEQRLCMTATEDILSCDFVAEEDYGLIGILLRIYHDFSQRRTWLEDSDLSSSPQHTVEQWLQRLLFELDELQLAGVAHLTVVREVIKKYDTMLSLTYNVAQGTMEQASDLRQLCLPLGDILQEISTQLEHQQTQSVPSGAITFSQIGQIRPLSYKLIVLLNMDMGAFPARDQHLAFDLMKLLVQQLGDRSRLEDHQGAFLDAILLAQQQLWFFYTGFEVESNEMLEPSNAVIEFVQHLDQLVQPKAAIHQVNVQGYLLASHLQSLYSIHAAQPFIRKGFEQSLIPRFKGVWYKVAQRLNQQKAESEVESSDVLSTLIHRDVPDYQLFNADTWAMQLEFPAKIFLKALNVSRLLADASLADSEPLIPTTLERYQFRQTSLNTLNDPAIEENLYEKLLDRLPVGKLKQSILDQQIHNIQAYQQRLKHYDGLTATTQRVYQQKFWVNESSSINIAFQIIVPEQNDGQAWCSISASDVKKGKYRLRYWLRYLFWLAYLDLGEGGQAYKLICLGDKDSQIQMSGVSSNQAKAYLQQWVDMWQYGQSQPVFCAANMILAEQNFTQNKHPFWNQQHSRPVLDDEVIKKIIKEWNATTSIALLPNSQNEQRKLHLDWQFILNQCVDGTNDEELLIQSLQQFAYLYEPLTQYQIIN